MHFPKETKELTFLILNRPPKCLFFGVQKAMQSRELWILTYKSNKVIE